MIKTKLLIIAAMAALGITLGGCLMPYESDYSCDYSKGYGQCLGARDNYKLSQMSETERARHLKGERTNDEMAIATDCDRIRESCGYQNGKPFDFETLQTLNKSGCLTPSETIALNNHEALLYIERLLLDRKAIEARTPSDTKPKVAIASFTNGYATAIGDNDRDDNDTGVKADGGLNNYGVIESEGEGGAISSGGSNKPLLSCDYPSLNNGDIIRVEAYRAWLRAKPDANYPVDRGLEAKRGEQYAVKGSKCGWVELDNGRYIHQSIVSVVNQQSIKRESNND
jgi:hypothetical protein